MALVTTIMTRPLLQLIAPRSSVVRTPSSRSRFERAGAESARFLGEFPSSLPLLHRHSA